MKEKVLEFKGTNQEFKKWLEEQKQNEEGK